MRKVMIIITQVLIFTGAYFIMTPDQVVDNTHLFGLIGSYDIIPGNAHWVMLGAAILSTLNIWVWWPKKSTTPSEKPAESTKSAEIKVVEEKDPVVPKMD